MRLKEQWSFPFSHVPFPAHEVLEWGPCPCRQENSRDSVLVPGCPVLKKRGGGAGGKQEWCVVVGCEQSTGAPALSW